VLRDGLIVASQQEPAHGARSSVPRRSEGVGSQCLQGSQQIPMLEPVPGAHFDNGGSMLAPLCAAWLMSAQSLTQPQEPQPPVPHSFASIAFEAGVIDSPPSAVQRSSRAMFSLIWRCASSTWSSGIRWS
jgi:hypothetical protein